MNEIAKLNQQIAVKKIIENNSARVVELEQEMRNLAQSIASIEKKEFVIERFTKHKITYVENTVNKLFSFIM